jgi:hypothetical protein
MRISYITMPVDDDLLNLLVISLPASAFADLVDG